MSNIARAALSVLVAILSTSEGVAAQVGTFHLDPPQWRLYTSPDRAFTAEFPCEPTRRNTSAGAPPLYEYDCGTYIGSALLIYMVDVFDLDGPAGERTVEETLTLFPAHKTVVESSPLAVPGGAGRDVVLRSTRDSADNMRVQIIAVGFRCYIASVSTTDVKTIQSPEVQRFFSSFRPLTTR
jgi:hypothetical protein